MRTVDSKSKRTGRIVHERVLTDDGMFWLGSDEADDFFDRVKSFHVQSVFDVPLGYTARKEHRSGTDHWYAYKRVQGQLMKRYIGQQITVHNLWDAAVAMVLPGTMQYAPFNANRKK